MLDLIKERIQLYSIHTTKWQETTFESDCIIPDSLPDISTVSSLDVQTQTYSVTRTSEGTQVNFNIIFKILYTPEKGLISEKTDAVDLKTFSYATEHTISFNESFPENAKVTPIFGIKNAESTISNSRKLSLKATINVQLNVTYCLEEDVCSEITGAEDIQRKNEIVPLIIYDNYISDTIEVNEGIELSAIKAPYKEILRSDAALRNVVVSSENGVLVLKGNLEICTLYIAEDATESMQIIENEASFTHSIPINDVENTFWNTDLQLTSFNTTIIQDADNENRILQISGAISVDAFSWKIQNIELLSDVYSLSKNITLEKKSVSAFDKAENINSQFIIKDSVVISENMPAISQIINVRADLCDYTFQSDSEKTNVSGNVTANLFYISSNKEAPICTVTANIPFCHAIENVLGDENIKKLIKLSINHISYNILSENEIELRISVSVKGMIAKTCIFDTITDATESEIATDEAEKPSILLYVVQTNDSLWKIAKKYNSPIDLLKEINHIRESDSIIPGQKILIPC